MKNCLFPLALLCIVLSCGPSKSDADIPPEAEVLTSANAQTYLAPNYEKIREEYKKAIPLWDQLKDFSISPLEECKLLMRIKYKDETVEYEIDVTQLDPENMKVFEDDEFIPGARFFTRGEEPALLKKVNGKSEKTSFMEVQLPTRESVEGFVFAFVGILNYCQTDFTPGDTLISK